MLDKLKKVYENVPEYFSHDGSDPKLVDDNREVKELAKYLRKIPKYGLLNNWERLKDCWIERGSTNPVEVDEMPDYTKLPYYEYVGEWD